ncbi:hypothetical protein ASPZODRAFT_147073 [Penicilliopsis zonata CBS 506.65]|uniref:Uncharacterized protein n=1 Tax=Penicilliopsis zonata CBS 506.65 TaxID=1073090 RepID=A0A1L9S670_9EURO|nr:hypothetical protein ASPZODRAFT_147073 [Penicilliopsis zonata CBS 506.65]OJJ42661.1 hypothetical protein ASPZODRAFT_147073 [Penicilliopsis zonata CBS 506.65]
MVTLFLFWKWSSQPSSWKAGDDLNQIVPQFSVVHIPFDYATDDFIPGPDEPNMTAKIWDNWSALMPRGNGVLDIPNFRDYSSLTLPMKNLIPEQQGSSRYSTAWVHQLHCLYFVMKEYHRVLHYGPDGSEYFIDATHNSYHASHCFNYLRQSILCSLDTTLEGMGQASGAADGSGQTHLCRSRDEVMAWLEANRWDDTQAIDEFPPEGSRFAD